MSFWGNSPQSAVDRWDVSPQPGWANPMRWSPPPVDEDERPPWSWLVAGPGNEAPQ